MTELRWVLLALGILVIVVVYLLSQGVPQRWLAPLVTLGRRINGESNRVEPAFEGDEPDDEQAAAEADQERSATAEPQKIVTIRFIPHKKDIGCERVILALRAAGLIHGRYGIFHKHENELSDEPTFSVANLTEPGSFDLSRISDTRIPGMSFFLILPGAADPVARFDSMVATARDLARELGGELKDEKGSSWSIQRERYVREEIIAYCHQVGRPVSSR